ncbi:hypothetical protein PIB30_007023 [Stylosanthes scabra]|uniref:Uncharacterized protein n=1 Tax=Stylosanthes scabra TaxID=79078 RepID=A0ABU6Z328_9FABA|nr:hypothetical protein [Stylosanthes scabra]
MDRPMNKLYEMAIRPISLFIYLSSTIRWVCKTDWRDSRSSRRSVNQTLSIIAASKAAAASANGRNNIAAPDIKFSNDAESLQLNASKKRTRSCNLVLLVTYRNWMGLKPGWESLGFG